MPTQPIRNYRLGQYQFSPYDQVSQGANPKYKYSLFQVNDPIKLKLIQYAFNRDTDGRYSGNYLIVFVQMVFIKYY